MDQGTWRPRRPIALAFSLAGIFATLGLLPWMIWGRNSADLVPLVGYAGVLAWFGTGLALTVRHPVSRVFLASTLIPPVSLAVFLLGWIARPEAIVRTWPIGGGLLLFASGIFAAVGSIAAIIGWWAWFREARARLPRRSR